MLCKTSAPRKGPSSVTDPNPSSAPWPPYLTRYRALKQTKTNKQKQKNKRASPFVWGTAKARRRRAGRRCQEEGAGKTRYLSPPVASPPPASRPAGREGTRLQLPGHRSARGALRQPARRSRAELRNTPAAGRPAGACNFSRRRPLSCLGQRPRTIPPSGRRRGGGSAHPEGDGGEERAPRLPPARPGGAEGRRGAAAAPGSPAGRGGAGRDGTGRAFRSRHSAGPGGVGPLAARWVRVRRRRARQTRRRSAFGGVWGRKREEEAVRPAGRTDAWQGTACPWAVFCRAVLESCGIAKPRGSGSRGTSSVLARSGQRGSVRKVAGGVKGVIRNEPPQSAVTRPVLGGCVSKHAV